MAGYARAGNPINWEDKSIITLVEHFDSLSDDDKKAVLDLVAHLAKRRK